MKAYNGTDRIHQTSTVKKMVDQYETVDVQILGMDTCQVGRYELWSPQVKLTGEWEGQEIKINIHGRSVDGTFFESGATYPIHQHDPVAEVAMRFHLAKRDNPMLMPVWYRKLLALSSWMFHNDATNIQDVSRDNNHVHWYYQRFQAMGAWETMRQNVIVGNFMQASISSFEKMEIPIAGIQADRSIRLGDDHIMLVWKKEEDARAFFAVWKQAEHQKWIKGESSVLTPSVMHMNARPYRWDSGPNLVPGEYTDATYRLHTVAPIATHQEQTSKRREDLFNSWIEGYMSKQGVVVSTVIG